MLSPWPLSRHSGPACRHRRLSHGIVPPPTPPARCPQVWQPGHQAGLDPGVHRRGHRLLPGVQVHGLPGKCSGLCEGLGLVHALLGKCSGLGRAGTSAWPTWQVAGSPASRCEWRGHPLPGRAAQGEGRRSPLGPAPRAAATVGTAWLFLPACPRWAHTGCPPQACYRTAPLPVCWTDLCLATLAARLPLCRAASWPPRTSAPPTAPRCRAWAWACSRTLPTPPFSGGRDGRLLGKIRFQLELNCSCIRLARGAGVQQCTCIPLLSVCCPTLLLFAGGPALHVTKPPAPPLARPRPAPPMQEQHPPAGAARHPRGAGADGAGHHLRPRHRAHRPPDRPVQRHG